MPKEGLIICLILLALAGATPCQPAPTPSPPPTDHSPTKNIPEVKRPQSIGTSNTRSEALVSAGSSEYPLESIVFDAAIALHLAEFQDWMVDKNPVYNKVDYPIKFFTGNFTGKKREECIAAIPWFYGCHAEQGGYSILYFRSNGTWIQSNMNINTITNKTQDTNGDGILELVAGTSFTNQGITVENIALFSFKDEHVKALEARSETHPR